MERKRRGPYGKRKLESDENTELSLSNPYDEVLSLIKDDDNILNIDQFSHEKQTKTIEQTDKHDFSKASGTPANVFETVDMQDEEQTLNVPQGCEIGPDYEDVNSSEDESHNENILSQEGIFLTCLIVTQI